MHLSSSPFTVKPVAVAAVMALAALAAHSPLAQAQISVAASQQLHINIAAQPLGQALNELARQANLQMSFPAALVAGKQAPTVSGNLTPRQALERLLAGSGLLADIDGSRVVVRAAPVASSGETTLPTVRVQAAVGDGRSEGTGRYTAAGASATATGLPLSLRETPQSVTVMTRQRLDDFKLETLIDVMTQTPGVSVSQQNDFNTFSVRGAAVNLQTEGARRISSGWGWNTHIVHTLDDMADIDRVEVLKGASGLINGDGAYGATVNLIRKRPTHEVRTAVSASAGSHDSGRLEADLSGPLNEEGSLRGRLVAARKQDRTHTGKLTEATTLYATAEYDLTPATLLSAGFTWRQRDVSGAGGTTPIQAYDGSGNAVPLMSRHYSNGAGWAGYRQDAYITFAKLEHRFGAGWLARLQATHDTIDTPEMRIGSLRYALPVVSTQYAWYRDIHSRDQNLMLDLQGPFSLFGREHQLLLGAGASRSRTTLLRDTLDNLVLAGADYAQGGGIVPQPAAPATFSNDYFSSKRQYVYAAGKLSLADPVSLIVGTRVSDYQQKDVTDIAWYNYQLRESGVVTPYAGLVVTATPALSLYASYASIYNAQSAKDASGNTLAPEEGRSYEVGMKGEFFDKRLNASLSHFWMRTDNTAEEVGVNDQGDSIYRAARGALRHGYELELSGALGRGWQAQGSYVQNSSNLNSSSSTPKHQFKLGSSYRFVLPNAHEMTVGGAVRWQSRTSVQRGSSVLSQAPYWLVDLMARYQLSSKLSVNANINNVFDKAYFAGVTNFESQGLFYTWGAPRSVSVGMRYEFD